MANSSPTPSLAQFSHVQPVPQGSACFGPGNGTDYYIFNSSLPTEGSMVCTQDTEWRNLTSVCCAPSIGIRSQTGCRLGDTQENRDFYANCTHQIALESRSDDTADVNAQIDLKCTPFSEFLDKQRTDTASSLSTVGNRIQIATKKKIPICASVGFPDRFNFTGQCCEKTGGASNGWQGLGGAPINCYWEDGEANVTKFKDCLTQFQTWPVCTNTTTESYASAQKKAGAETTACLGVGLGVAAAALAAVL